MTTRSNKKTATTSFVVDDGVTFSYVKIRIGNYLYVYVPTSRSLMYLLYVVRWLAWTGRAYLLQKFVSNLLAKNAMSW